MGNVAIVVVWVNYCEVFVNKSEAKWGSILIALVGLWVPAIVNLAGLKNFAAFQVVTTILKFIPLVFFAFIGIFWLTSADFTSGSVPNGTSVLGAISAGAPIALFSYLGLEAASVAAGKVKDPERNVSRATILGTLGCAVVYVLSPINPPFPPQIGNGGCSKGPPSHAREECPEWHGSTSTPRSANSSRSSCTGRASNCPGSPRRTSTGCLFDDVMWAQRAREEHDAFARSCATRASWSTCSAELFTEALDQPGAREFLQDKFVDGDAVRPDARGEAADELVASAPAGRLAEALIGGVLRRDLTSTRDPAFSGPTSGRVTSSCHRCPTTCSSGTTPPGCTTGCRSTR